MVSATFLKVCRQSDELSPSTKYVLPRIQVFTCKYIYTYIHYDS